MELEKLSDHVKDLNIRLINTKSLLYEAKYIQADQKIQGALRKCELILQIVVNAETEGNKENVAQKTPCE